MTNKLYPPQHTVFTSIFKTEPIMPTSLQNTLNLVARLLLMALFLPAGIAKLSGFAGTVGYIAVVGGLLAIATNR